MTTQAPDWQLATTLGHKLIGPEDYRGQLLLILFFNMGCAGCTGRAIPFTRELLERNPDLNVVAIHSDFEQSRPTPIGNIEAVANYFKLPYPIVVDDGSTTFDRYAAEGTPHWILIGKNGEILKSIFGSMGTALQRLDYAMLELEGAENGNGAV